MEYNDLFSDIAFKNAMDNLYKENDSKNIEFKDITELCIEEAHSLEDLKHFPNLKEIVFGYCDFESIKLLGTMFTDKLKSLCFDSCRIHDFSPIWDCTNLIELIISCGNVNIDNIERLVNLKSLYLPTSHIDDFSKISVCRNLENLSLEDCELGNIDFLSSLKNLKYLNISLCGVKDLSPIKHLKNLTSLLISFNPVEFDKCSLSELECIEKITELGMFSLPYTERFMDKIKGIEKICISGENCKNLEQISNYKDLTSLEVHGCTQNSIDAIGKMKNLKILALFNCTATDISMLLNLNRLEDLTIHDCKILNIEPLAEMATLKSISIARINSIDGEDNMDAAYAFCEKLNIPICTDCIEEVEL